MKGYVEVGDFERETGLCPVYIAWQVLDEMRDYLRTDISGHYAYELALRAERVFARQPFWQAKFRSHRGRDHLLAAMRHWLAGLLARKKPALFLAT